MHCQQGCTAVAELAVVAVVAICNRHIHRQRSKKAQSHLSQSGPCDAIIVLESIVSVVGHLNMEWIRQNVTHHHKQGRRKPTAKIQTNKQGSSKQQIVVISA
jgi:hypothetical protein